ncbi:MAG: hypothetical protein F6K65_21205 [Moorea sp. SIO3C2]|nr:hypothetical protein [Moorena sp. SIO3C2]
MATRVTPKTGIDTTKVWTQISKLAITLLLVILFPASVATANRRVGAIEPLILNSFKELLNQLPPAAEDTPVRVEGLSQTTKENILVLKGKKLLEELPPMPDNSLDVEFFSVPPQVIRQGFQVYLNGQRINLPWQQWLVGSSVRTGISDVGAMQTLGIEMLNSKDYTKQPIRWFSKPRSTSVVFPSQVSGAYRYLDITDFAKTASWQLQVQGDKLYISSMPARVKTIRQGRQPWGNRIVLDLDRPTFWQVNERPTEAVITVAASAEPSLVKGFNALETAKIQGPLDVAPISVSAPMDKPVIRLESHQNQTRLRVDFPKGKRLRVFTLPNPFRLVIDLRPDAMVKKDILWAPGIQWRQQLISLKDTSFPVVWLEVDPKSQRLRLRPIGSNATTQVGTAPLIKAAQWWQASAAINAGFFNRNNQLPLGAIRRDSRWLSGPILNRGAIAWNDRGHVKLGRLSLSETLVTSHRKRLPVLFLNSGYVKAGIARYTRAFGPTYTPLIDHEIIVVIQNNLVTDLLPGGLAGQQAFRIPDNGYLVTLRANSTAVNDLSIGTQVRIEGSTFPTDFNGYPHILGGGPLLVQDRKIVLDGKSEQFSDAFIQQSAPRSAIGTSANGRLIIAAFHHSHTRRGPTLRETAQLMQKLGAINALNLDGGSSTGLYLGGQLLDRSPYTAAPVNNGLGIFFTPVP